MTAPDRQFRYVALGAGVQSTTVLLMVLDGQEAADFAVFADTGWEPPAVYEHLWRLAERCAAAGFPLYVVADGNIRTRHLNPGGVVTMPLYINGAGQARPGRLHRSCTVNCTLQVADHYARLVVIVHRRHRKRTVPAHSRALLVAVMLRSMFGLWPLEGSSTCSAIAKGIDEGRETDDPDRGKANETLAWPRRPPDRAVLGNVFNDRHHDVADNNCSRQDRSDGETEGHAAERHPVATHVHTRDGNPHRTAILVSRPDQAPPQPFSRAGSLPTGQPSQPGTSATDARSRSVATKPNGQPWQVQISTDRHKVRPINRFLRAHVGGSWRGVHVTRLMGISWDEIERMKPARERWSTAAYPLIDRRMTRADCLAWCAERGVYPPRSACVGCPMHSPAHWRAMRDTDPASFADAVAFDTALRSGADPTAGRPEPFGRGRRYRYRGDAL